MATVKKVRRIRKRKPFYKQGIFYVMTLFLCLASYLFYQIKKLNLLPNKYLIIVGILFLLLMYWMVHLQTGKKVKRASKSVGRILVLVLCLVFGYGNWYIYKMHSTLTSLTDKNVETTKISVIVLQDSPAQQIVDLTYTNVGIANVGDTKTQEKVFNQIKEELENQIYDYSYASYKELSDALFNRNIQAMIINESTRSIFKKIVPDFNKKTRVLKTYTYTRPIKQNGNHVDILTKPFNIYITGMDTKGSIDTTSHSDVNMILSINPNTNQILVTGIPRDYYIPQTCQSYQEDKLTHTGVFGVDCTLDSVQGYLGIDLDYYAKVNFSTFVDIIDALGGIDVDNPIEFSRKQYNYPVGNIHLDGDAALQYARERKSLEGGDRARSRNQMRVIEAIIKKAMSPAIITRYTEILDTVGNMLQTNMSHNEMTSFIRHQLNTKAKWDFKHIQLTGTDSMTYSPANGFDSWVMIPYKPSVDHAIELITKFHNNDYVTDEDIKKHEEIVRASH